MKVAMTTDRGLARIVDIDDQSILADENGYVLSFATLSHHENGDEHFHVYHLTRGHKKNDRGLFDLVLQDIRSIQLSRPALGAVFGGTGRAMKIAADKSNKDGQWDPTIHGANMFRQARNGAIIGFAVPYVISIIIKNIHRHLTESHNKELNYYYYINVTGHEGDNYIGPLQLKI